jgi:hypothetical protein
MGLFVVGRLAAQHGLVVRLRNTVVAEPNSGTTAGVFIPAELLLHGPGGPELGAPEYREPAGYGVTPAEPHLAVVPTYVAEDDHDDHDDYQDQQDYAADVAAEPEYRNGHADIPISLLPQRNPGASGISDIPSAPIEPVAHVEPVAESEDQWAEQEWPEEHWPADPPPAPVVDRPVPTDTSSFFAAKATNGVHRSGADEPVEAVAPEPAPQAPTGGSIFDTMLSEWLIDDPFKLAKSSDLDWQTVWDQGWSAAGAAEEAPVEEHTEEGLPMRQPGARLVPGAAVNGDDVRHGRHGGAHHGVDDKDDASNSTFDTGPIAVPRDPEAVRSSIGSHFGGVHAGRSHARETRSTDED